MNPIERPRQQKRGYPVKAVDGQGVEVSNHPSLSAAARHYRVNYKSIMQAVERGNRCAEVWWRYSDMPDSAQPLKPGNNWKRSPGDRRVTFLGGVEYPSQRAAAIANGLKPSTLNARRVRAARQEEEIACCATSG